MGFCALATEVIYHKEKRAFRARLIYRILLMQLYFWATFSVPMIHLARTYSVLVLSFIASVKISSCFCAMVSSASLDVLIPVIASLQLVWHSAKSSAY